MRLEGGWSLQQGGEAADPAHHQQQWGWWNQVNVNIKDEIYFVGSRPVILQERENLKLTCAASGDPKPVENLFSFLAVQNSSIGDLVTH